MTVEVLRTALIPPRPDLAGAKLRLFETALVLFGDRGFHAVSVRELMGELGQQPGALYAHAPSKQHLLYELMSIGLDVHREVLQAALLDAGREPAEQVRAITEAHVRVHLDYSALARVTNRETRALSAEHLEDVMRRRTDASQLFLDVVDRGARLGAFHVDQPALLVQAIGALGIRAAEWWTPDSPQDKETVIRTYGDFALKLVS